MFVYFVCIILLGNLRTWLLDFNLLFYLPYSDSIASVMGLPDEANTNQQHLTFG